MLNRGIDASSLQSTGLFCVQFQGRSSIVYEDDRQIVQAELVHLRIDSPFSIPGVSEVLMTSLRAGKQFVYVRIEDPVDPFPLPK